MIHYLLTFYVGLEMFCKQNPFVELKLGDGSRWSHATESQPDAGCKAKWKELSISGKIRQYQLYDEDITIRVKDKNEGGVDKFIGKADIIASSLLDTTNTWIELTGDLLDKQGAEVCGNFMVRARFRMNGEEVHGNDIHYDSDNDPPDAPPVEEEPAKVGREQSVSFVEDVADKEEKGSVDKSPVGYVEVVGVKLSNLRSVGKCTKTADFA
jgi:hypothetical protein